MGPIIGSGIFGTILVFNGVFAYTVDAYRLYAATAIATNSFIRCTMAGGFPLFGLQMYKEWVSIGPLPLWLWLVAYSFLYH